MERPKGLLLRRTQNENIWMVFPVESKDTDVTDIEPIALLGRVDAMVKEQLVTYKGKDAPEQDKWLITYVQEGLGVHEADSFEEAKELLNFQVGTMGMGLGIESLDLEQMLIDKLAECEGNKPN